MRRRYTSYALVFVVVTFCSSASQATIIWGNCPSDGQFASEVCPDEYDINTCGVGDHPSGDLDECSCSNHGGTFVDGVCEG